MTDMTAYDSAPAHTLEVGDTIRFIDEDGDDYGLQEIKAIRDHDINSNVLVITSEDGTEMETDFDTPFYLYAYTD